jgi:CBS domain-containing protein
MQISQLMSTNPVWIMEHNLVSDAKRLCAEYQIKHLPVLDLNGVIRGILSDRDIKMHQAVSDDPDFHSKTKVSEIYIQHPYTVTENTSASEVLEHMYTKRIGSVLVSSQGKLSGIFTSMDACRVLSGMI